MLELAVFILDVGHLWNLTEHAIEMIAVGAFIKVDDALRELLNIFMDMSSGLTSAKSLVHLETLRDV